MSRFAKPSDPDFIDSDVIESGIHRKAQHVVAGHSESAAECTQFLAMLGIHAEPRDTEGTV